ncbi:hypothetical protein VTH06DRAFT_2429 [Thermothelomyces fergusii]
MHESRFVSAGFLFFFDGVGFGTIGAPSSHVPVFGFSGLSGLVYCGRTKKSSSSSSSVFWGVSGFSLSPSIHPDRSSSHPRPPCYRTYWFSFSKLI